MTVRRPSRRVSQLLGGALILMIGLAGQPAQAAPRQGAESLAAAFDRAAARSDVPRDLLAALGYAETRLDGHHGEPSASGGYGVMHLTSNPKVRTLDEAVRRARLDRTELRTRDAATPYIVVISNGNQTVTVNQTANGGGWRSLGTFTLTAGDTNKVGISRWPGSTGHVIADPIRITRV
ncbi:hypothetical protein OOK41_22445 [Micromonospora sp. NBC_01655]|uniref:golvesin C-terminal-like domain-containing protein n=1 Tax=Micromonospora sp. NBC_01655 TaxID=2975983 RepID=UPI0022527049|nr:hypothetical protein [Micromonospora sp. NBC_01655]MCX4473037.1 hypothetical protein [Micromonospora sp. NBC_01655]